MNFDILSLPWICSIKIGIGTIKIVVDNNLNITLLMKCFTGKSIISLNRYSLVTINVADIIPYIRKVVYAGAPNLRVMYESGRLSIKREDTTIWYFLILPYAFTTLANKFEIMSMRLFISISWQNMAVYGGNSPNHMPKRKCISRMTGSERNSII